MKHIDDTTDMACTRAARACSVAVALASLTAIGCSDGATVIDQRAEPALADPATGVGEAQQPGGSVYAMTTHAFGPDMTTSYLVAIPSLSEGTVMDLGTAIELPDYANVSGIPGEPYVWLGYDLSPIVERWDLGQSGQFERGPRLSFANLGAATVSPDAQGAFISRELAAVPNQATGELVLWNPAAMELVNTLDLEIPERDGVVPLVRSTVVRSDGTLLLSYYYLSDEGDFADVAGIVIVDPSVPAVVGRDEWEGCNYNYARIAQDGTVYLTVSASWTQRSLIYPAGPWLAKSCLLRILPGATQFDREFDPNVLGALSGGRPITGNLELLNDHQAFFVAWHDELRTQEFTVDNFDDVQFSTPAYKWYFWDMETGQASEVPAEPFAALPSVNIVDGRVFYSDQRSARDNGGRGRVPYFELTADGPTPAFTGVGTTWNMLRIR
jgi:hypothetical protein